MESVRVQAQRVSIAGSWLRASELKRRFFVHTQQDVIAFPGLMVQNMSLPIKNHVSYNCATGVAHGSCSILHLPHLTVLRPIIHLQNRS